MLQRPSIFTLLLWLLCALAGCDDDGGPAAADGGSPPADALASDGGADAGDPDASAADQSVAGDGGTAAEWSAQMVATVDRIIADAPPFRAYLNEGDKHCIIPYDELYSTEVNGVRLVHWLRDLVDGKPVQTERCAACVP